MVVVVDDDDVVIWAAFDHSLRIWVGDGGDPTGIHCTVDPTGGGVIGADALRVWLGFPTMSCNAA